MSFFRIFFKIDKYYPCFFLVNAKTSGCSRKFELSPRQNTSQHAFMKQHQLAFLDLWLIARGERNDDFFSVNWFPNFIFSGLLAIILILRSVKFAFVVPIIFYCSRWFWRSPKNMGIILSTIYIK